MTESVKVVYHEDHCKINLLSSVQSEEIEFPTVLLNNDLDKHGLDEIEMFTENEIPLAHTTISSTGCDNSEYNIISNESSHSPDQKPVESPISSYFSSDEHEPHMSEDEHNIIVDNEIMKEYPQTTLSFTTICKENGYNDDDILQKKSQSLYKKPVKSKPQRKKHIQREKIANKQEESNTKDINARKLLTNMIIKMKTANQNAPSNSNWRRKKTYFIPDDISKSPEDGPVQPRLDSYPKSMHGGTKSQSFCASLFDKFPWLEYSISLDKVYCFACRHFSDQDFSAIHKKGKLAPTVYATTGFCIFIKAHERMQRHSCSAKHLSAMEPWLNATIKRELDDEASTYLNLQKTVAEKISEITPKCNKVETKTQKRKCSDKHLKVIMPRLKNSIKEENDETNQLFNFEGESNADSITSQAKKIPKLKVKKSPKDEAKTEDILISSKLKGQTLVLPNHRGRTLHSSWCNCVRCKPMPTQQESICCTEIGVIKSKIKSVEGPFFCITEHPGFNAVCLNSWVLQTAYYNMKKDAKPRVVSGLSEKYRHTAYAQFARWCWGSLLGKDTQVPIPSCVIYAIRNSFQSSANCRYPPLDDL